jgi:anti-sigma B factor antagonist
MEDNTLQVEIESGEGATILSPRGDVDMSRASSFREHVRGAQLAKPPRLVINMESVEYMDSSGLATLVEAMRNGKSLSVDLVLCCMQPKVLAVFEIARLDKFFNIVATRDEALA